MNELSSISCKKVSLRPTVLLEVILYSNKKFNDKSLIKPPNTATINYIKITQPFQQVLFSISEGKRFYQIARNALTCFS